jgi:hypothetical protein
VPRANHFRVSEPEIDKHMASLWERFAQFLSLVKAGVDLIVSLGRFDLRAFSGNQERGNASGVTFPCIRGYSVTPWASFPIVAGKLRRIEMWGIASAKFGLSRSHERRKRAVFLTLSLTYSGNNSSVGAGLLIPPRVSGR